MQAVNGAMWLVVGMLLGTGACFLSVERIRFPGVVFALLLVISFIVGYLAKAVS